MIWAPLAAYWVSKAMVPSTVMAVVIVALPVSVAPSLTVTVLAIAELKLTSPARTMIAPSAVTPA